MRIWFNIVCLKLYQFKRITWWCLYVFEFIMEYVLEYVLQFVMLKKILKIKKSWSISRPCTLIHDLPCRIPCRLLIHELLCGPWGLHLLVWSELGRSPPFWPIRALTLPWSWAFNLVWKGPNIWRPLMHSFYFKLATTIGVTKPHIDDLENFAFKFIHVRSWVGNCIQISWCLGDFGCFIHKIIELL